MKYNIFFLLLTLNLIASQYITIYEKHGNYCGLKNSKTHLKPIDEIDECCYYHDSCVNEYSLKDMGRYIKLAKCIVKYTVESDYYLHEYHRKIYKTVERLVECFDVKRETETKSIGLGLGILFMLIPPLAPVGLAIGGASAMTIPYNQDINECKDDAKYILGNMYEYFMN